MVDSAKNLTRVLYSWLKQYDVRGFIFGLIYVLLLITVGQVTSQYTAVSHRKSAQIGQQLELRTLLRSIPKVRRESRYDSVIKDLSAVLKVRTHYEQCPALLIHANLIVTGGDCAQSLGFDHLKGQSWRVSLPRNHKINHLNHNPRLRAKVVKSLVNPQLQLAIHVLDQELPYAPLNLPQTGIKNSHFEHTNQKVDLVHSHEFSGFLVYRDQVSGSLLLSGRIKNTRYKPFNMEAITWLNSTKQSLLALEQEQAPSTNDHLMISKL